MNESMTELLETALERTVTVGGPDGEPVVQLKLLHAAAAAAAGVVIAPRLTAAAAVAAIFKGITITLDEAAEDPA